jgi:hypothetical protein
MATPQRPQPEFVKAISRLDATALVVGSMIGSGIFIVSADILRQVHAPGLLLLVWALSGVVTLMGALSYGELAAMFPKAGGQYVYLREAISPLFGYLYGWTLFMVIQTGTIAAVAVALANSLGILAQPHAEVYPGLGTTIAFPQPIGNIAVGFPQRVFAIASVILLTWINVRGVRSACIIQTSLTAKAYRSPPSSSSARPSGATPMRSPEFRLELLARWRLGPGPLPLLGAAMVDRCSPWTPGTTWVCRGRDEAPEKDLPISMALGT